jgi:hypothetical protein
MLIPWLLLKAIRGFSPNLWALGHHWSHKSCHEKLLHKLLAGTLYCEKKNAICVGPVPSWVMFFLVKSKKPFVHPSSYYSCCILITPIIVNLQNGNLPTEPMSLLNPNLKTAPK